MPFLQEFNLRINWVIGLVQIKDTKKQQAQQKTKLI